MDYLLGVMAIYIECYEIREPKQLSNEWTSQEKSELSKGLFDLPSVPIHNQRILKPSRNTQGLSPKDSKAHLKDTLKELKDGTMQIDKRSVSPHDNIVVPIVQAQSIRSGITSIVDNIRIAEHDLRHNNYKKRVRERANAKKISIDLKEKSLYFILISSMLMIMIGTVFRYQVLTSTIKSPLVSYKLAYLTVDLYISLIELNLSTVQTVLWNNTSLYRFKPPIEVSRYRKKHIEEQILPKITSILSTERTESTQMYSRLYYMPYCDAIKVLVPDGYAKCESALGGITQKPLGQFVYFLLNLVDQLVLDWSLLPDLDLRAGLLTRSQYHSYLGYLLYDNYGTSDIIYFHLIVPLFGIMAQEVINVPTVISLTNIIYGIWTFIVAVVFITLGSFKIYRIQLSYWGLYKSMPMHLLNSNIFVKEWVRVFRSNLHQR
jgi:hypothetical protein